MGRPKLQPPGMGGPAYGRPLAALKHTASPPAVRPRLAPLAGVGSGLVEEDCVNAPVTVTRFDDVHSNARP